MAGKGILALLMETPKGSLVIKMLLEVVQQRCYLIHTSEVAEINFNMKIPFFKENNIQYLSNTEVQISSKNSKHSGTHIIALLKFTRFSENSVLKTVTCET